ncbi:nucleotidyl transferase AbiEii/AbiGii toxin family protein [Mesorhizobium sp. MSK_1335]|uniref:Nucleotidyl transferase AbiEii/AbiGii toxin family protein n=1 Tax=Mesorhizobium montanum TaxID=3072323 RepID=A0ABU4ZT70_9HYPH|nr:nucleotidyl transferase AbiEii/AbiGii toxin family protein [Mesorhizobium sp. MSK_1335]MDX8528599.1 nucleotidyl transferase AbiEii/AbiGii toxin family protein [Mesorhizobium sp. MSK_1335]
MSHWRLLLDRAVTGLDRLRAKGQPVPDWVLGGGTALMVHTGHRLSKDIDAFIDDPQYLSILSPRLGGEGIWDHQAYDEAANYLKLIYPEGEIDFIVASYITDVPTGRTIIDPTELSQRLSHSIEIEHPVEIALKKLNYRGTLLKVRDIFDIAVVDHLFPDVLQDNLRFVSHLKAAIGTRLINLQEDYVRNELGELNIAEEWRPIADVCLDRMREIAEAIPEPKSTP